MLCKHCGTSGAVKNGFAKEKQRYACKACKRTFRLGDERVKYTKEQQEQAIKWYLDGVGIMSIERQMKIPNPLIIRWIRRYGASLEEKLRATPPPQSVRDIQILELDELYSYIKKNSKKSISGLLWIGSEAKWWVLK